MIFYDGGLWASAKFKKFKDRDFKLNNENDVTLLTKQWNEIFGPTLVHR